MSARPPPPAKPSFTSLILPTPPEPAHGPSSGGTTAPPASSTPKPKEFLVDLFRRVSGAIATTVEGGRRDRAGEAAAAAGGGYRGGVYPPLQAPLVKEDPLPRNHPRPPAMAEMKTWRRAGGAGCWPRAVFVQSEMLDVAVVGADGIDAFGWGGHRVLRRELGQDPCEEELAEGVCAVYVQGRNEVVVGHADRAVRTYRMASGNMGALAGTLSLDAMTVRLIVEKKGEEEVVVAGGEDGGVRFLDETLAVKHVWLPPERSSPTGAFVAISPVAGLCFMRNVGGQQETKDEEALEARLVVAYRNGMVCGPGVGVPFCAHSGGITGIVGLLGCVAVTVGDARDPTVAATLSSGVCVARRHLDYTPTAIASVEQEAVHGSRHPLSSSPSENAFIVGGENGEVEMYRCVIYGPGDVELLLIRRVSSKQRGRLKAISCMTYSKEDSVLIAVNENGEIRKWRMSNIEASALSLTELVENGFTEDTIEKDISSLTENRHGSRISSLQGVFKAQEFLAKLNKEKWITDEDKDILVEGFAEIQEEMQRIATRADAELRRTAIRIRSRYSPSLRAQDADESNDNELEKCMRRAGRRTAALELGFAVGGHAESLKHIERTAAMKLGQLLSESLNNTTEDSKSLRAIKEQLASFRSGELMPETSV